MKIISYPTAIIVIAFFLSCQQTPHSSSDLLLNITSDATLNPHSTVMGLHLGQKALKNDIPVIVFFNVAGPKILLPGADTIAFHGENVHALLKEMEKEGATILFCPHCMHVNGVHEEDLPEGFHVAHDSVMVSKLKSDLTVFTY